MPQQLRLEPDGDWHRPEAIDGGHRTACGEIIFAYQSRDGGVDRLCPLCFTVTEIETGEMELIAREYAAYDPELFHDSDEEPTDPNGQESLDKPKETP
jgi:hypothetical protein